MNIDLHGDSAEILLMHLPLAHVFAFVNLRDDVRAFVADQAPASERDTVSSGGGTQRILGYVDEAAAE